MILARRIIYMAQAGQVDVVKLRDDAVAYLSSSFDGGLIAGCLSSRAPQRHVIN
jgi:hypothetical protein